MVSGSFFPVLLVLNPFPVKVTEVEKQQQPVHL